MRGPRCKNCCPSRSASRCHPRARRTDAEEREYDPGCVRHRVEGLPAVMSLNANTLQLLSAYIDGELSAAEREAVERALAADPRVREIAQSMRSLGPAMRATSEARVAQADFTG